MSAYSGKFKIRPQRLPPLWLSSIAIVLFSGCFEPYNSLEAKIYERTGQPHRVYFEADFRSNSGNESVFEKAVVVSPNSTTELGAIGRKEGTYIIKVVVDESNESVEQTAWKRREGPGWASVTLRQAGVDIAFGWK